MYQYVGVKHIEIKPNSNIYHLENYHLNYYLYNFILKKYWDKKIKDLLKLYVFNRIYNVS